MHAISHPYQYTIGGGLDNNRTISSRRRSHFALFHVTTITYEDAIMSGMTDFLAIR